MKGTIYLFILVFSQCNAWTAPRIPMPTLLRADLPTEDLALKQKPQEKEVSPSQIVEEGAQGRFLWQALVGSLGVPILALSLFFGVADNALASDDSLLFDLSKEDSAIIESRAPPEIQATSSDRAVALSKKLSAMNAKMYGAYWCKFCAKQKESFGKEAFATLEYKECSEDGKGSQADLCQEKKIRGFPTWEINGKLYSGERSLEEMEVLVRMVEASSPGQGRAPPMVMTTSSERAIALAKQLNELNSNLFGAYWDPHTFEAKERLGAGAMTKIPYVECGKDGDNSQLDLCKQKGVQVVPTWSVNGKLYPGDRDFDELEEIVASTKAPAAPAATTSAVASADTSTAETPKQRAPAVEKAKPSPPPIETKSSDKTLSLAKQMESLNTRMYGAYFCPHSKDQRELFGKEAFKTIAYIECTLEGEESQLALCQENGITSVPTWSINGKLFVGQRSIDQLQELVTAELAQTQQPKAPPPILATSTDQALKLASSMESLDAKLYGAHWCRFTQSQKEKFGSEAFKKIQYVECAKDGLNSATSVCQDKRIEGFPTWELGGKLYPGDQELEELEDIVKEALAE